MPYDDYGNYYADQAPQQRGDNPFIVEQPQTQQQSPMGGLSGLSGMMGAEGGGAGSMLGGGSAVGSSSGAGAGAGSSGAGSAMSSAGPWAALAAVIIANEMNAQDYRDEDSGDYAEDVLGGKVLEQDMNQRWLPKIFGEDLENDDLGLGADISAGADIGTLDFSNAWDTISSKGILSKLF